MKKNELDLQDLKDLLHDMGFFLKETYKFANNAFSHVMDAVANAQEANYHWEIAQDCYKQLKKTIEKFGDGE